MMLCKKCKKAAATVHLTEIKSGKRNELHLCEQCAREMNLPHQQTISLSELIGNLIEKSGKKGSFDETKRCSECGISYSDFQKSGRLGCARDYRVFEEELEPLLKKVHGSARYIGKVPDGQSSKTVRRNELIKQKELLARAIKAEKYEEAAKLRDRILELESLISGSVEGGGRE